MQDDDKRTRGSILVVDDEAVITEVLDTLLDKQGYDVTVATDGASAIEKAEQVNPDLIVMDIAMPCLDGYETTAQIRSNPSLKDIPVIFLSGRPPTEDGGRAFKSGGSMYLKKPFSNNQLLMIVDLALGNQP